MRLFWSFFLRIQGWTINGSFPHHLKKCILIIGPHTSSWDFVIGLAFRSKLKLYHCKFLGKEELFKPPFGFFFRKLGGFPVNRSGQHNMVEQVVSQFDAHESFLLVLSPEGTRKKVDRLRTGFYHIAKKANVSILMAGFDFAKKQMIISEPFFATSDEEADFQHIFRFFAPIQGKIPENGITDFNTPKE